MHIVISVIGTFGDVFPFISVGRSLARRGHEVQFLTSEHFRAHVEREGLAFFSVLSSEDYLAATRDPKFWAGWWGLRETWQRWWAVVPNGYRELERHIRPGETVLFGSHLALWNRLAEEKHALPAATMHLVPSSLFSAENPSPATFGPLARLPPRAMRGVISLIERAIVDPLVLPDLNAFRGDLGLASVNRAATTWLNSPQRVICAFPDWFAAPAGDWPKNAVCSGFPRPAVPVGETLDAALAEFIARGSPPIAFTPGSGMPHAAVFFERALAACARLGRRAILLTQYPEQLPATLPDFAFHSRFVHYELLAPHVAAFVHHGGIGTTALLLASGTPQLITPFAIDQPDNAARAVQLGVAKRIAPRAPLGNWVRALASLIDNPAIRSACSVYARKIANDPPAQELIADWIERLGSRSADGNGLLAHDACVAG